MSETKALNWKSLISVPPHTLLSNGELTQRYHVFFDHNHAMFFTLPEAKRVLAMHLHILRGGTPFVQYRCIPNKCPLWLLAEATMNGGADKFIAMEFANDGKEIVWRDKDKAELHVKDALKALSRIVAPLGQNPRNN